MQYPCVRERERDTSSSFLLECFQGSPCTSTPSFLVPNNTPLYRYSTFTKPSVDDHLGFYFLGTMIQIMLPLIFVGKFLCGCIFSFLLDIYLGAEFLDHVYHSEEVKKKKFPKQVHHFIFLTAMRVLTSPHTHEYLLPF